MLFLNICIGVLFVILRVKSQEYDFAAEIKRQCLVPDPVGLLDCVENRVTLPYLKSWVECTNSLGENVKTSADIINYRCKSVWEGKPVIPEVFYIKDCVIEKAGLPPKNVSAEVLGAYKQCESSPIQPGEISSRTKTAPLQQQQVAITPPQQIATIKSARPQPQLISSTQSVPNAIPTQFQQQQGAPISAQNYAQPINTQQIQVRQPFSQQFFAIYPRPPMPIQQQSIPASSVTYQQNPSGQPLSQQQVPISASAFSSPQQSTAGSIIQNQQHPTSYTVQQQIPTQALVPQTQQSIQNFPMYGPVPNGAYYYAIQIQHPQRIF